MKKMFLLFSHTLTKEQMNEAREKFAVEEFVYLPEGLQKQWSSFPTDESSIKPYIEPFKQFITENVSSDDVVLVQGESGASYSMVQFSKKMNLLTVYATTRRRVVEDLNEKGEKVKKSIFEHRRFREYGN